MFEFFTVIWLIMVCGASLTLAVFGVTRTETAKLMFFPKTARNTKAAKRSVIGMVGVFSAFGTGLMIVLLYLWV